MLDCGINYKMSIVLIVVKVVFFIFFCIFYFFVWVKMIICEILMWNDIILFYDVRLCDSFLIMGCL